MMLKSNRTKKKRKRRNYWKVSTYRFHISVLHGFFVWNIDWMYFHGRAWKVDQDFPSIHWTFDLTVHEMLYFLLVSLVCPIIACKWMHVMSIYLIQGLAPICYTHMHMGWVYYELLSYKKGHNDYKRKTLDIAFIYFIWPGLLYIQ